VADREHRQRRAVAGATTHDHVQGSRSLGVRQLLDLLDHVDLDATVNPARLTFDDLTSTSSDCPEQLRRVDEAFLQALARTQSIRLDGGRLVLDGPGGTLVFERVVGDSSDST